MAKVKQLRRRKLRLFGAMQWSLYVCLASKNVSQKAMLLIDDNNFYLSLKFHKLHRKSKGLIFMKFCPRFEKTVQRYYQTRYCDKSNCKFETL